MATGHDKITHGPRSHCYNRRSMFDELLPGADPVLLYLLQLGVEIAPLLLIMALFSSPATNSTGWLRFRAATIDAWIAAAIVVPSFFIGAYGGPDVSLIFFLGPAVATSYLLLRDGTNIDLARHRSVGKHALHLEIEQRDRIPMHPGLSILRNLPMVTVLLVLLPTWRLIMVLALTVECLLVRFAPHGQRIGDRLAGTTVLIPDPTGQPL